MTNPEDLLTQHNAKVKVAVAHIVGWFESHDYTPDDALATIGTVFAALWSPIDPRHDADMLDTLLSSIAAGRAAATGRALSEIPKGH